MKVISTKHTTKSGNKIVIREAKLSDAKNLIDCINSYLKSNFIPLTHEEFNPTIEEQKNWINKLLTEKTIYY